MILQIIKKYPLFALLIRGKKITRLRLCITYSFKKKEMIMVGR